MRVLIFEFVTGGGFLSLPNEPLPIGSLLDEGAAMAAALVSDFARLSDDVDLTVFRDHRLRSLIDWPNCSFRDVHVHADVTRGLTQRSDVAIVIAPESDGMLLRACQMARPATELLLNAPDEFLAWASSKHETASWLLAHNVPCPTGQLVCDREQVLLNGLRFPLVAKPNDGCGSQQVTLLRSREELERLFDRGATWRVEEFVRGRAASVSALCGHGHVHWLQPCWQVLEEPNFAYQGSRLIEDPKLQRRAWQLGGGLESRLADAVGYVGVDIVLGETADGSADYVIEVNSRLTTSYVCLRSFYRTNLVAAMLDVARGARCDSLARSQLGTGDLGGQACQK